MKKDVVLATIFERTSVRKYAADKAVSRDDVLTLVKAGMAAPCSKNSQAWKFIVITERAKLDAMAAELPFAKMLSSAATAIAVCGDMSKSANPEAGLWVQDCSAATENILLAATALGYGAVWTAVYPYEERLAAVKRALQQPDNIVPLCVIPVGVPEAEPKPKDKWKPENVVWM